ncbi:MAG: tRNA uridine-5-carboxymethylaminomethyl(34) synthesis GTPase MnmE, partial [Spirochaetia bacterium]|nr:tRNA uridine-5-carboxymethylaminomethyl(34) synthesis GTPase MnmE [Spirochaetia bacterium]
MDSKRPIAALATAPGRSALAVIRCSGPGTIELCARCFSSGEALASAPGYSMVHGWLEDSGSGERIDEALAAVFRAPRSFTGEDSVEFYCHGSSAVVARALAVLEQQGFSPALPGEFSFRAFINGKTDLVKAEAINELASANCEAARQDALDRLSGTLSKAYKDLRDDLLDLLAELEARLDYPADETEGEDLGTENSLTARLQSCQDRVQRMAEGYIAGKLRQEGALVVVAGRPNAGKSRLFNLILREERAIVSSEPGTTRDWLEVWVELSGYALRLVDTAGLRQALGDVEAEGVRRSMELSARADIVLYMADGRKGLSEEDKTFLERYPEAIKLWNKIDLDECPEPPAGWHGLSAKTGTGLPELETAVANKLAAVAGGGAASQKESLRLASSRQKNQLDQCLAALSAAQAAAARDLPL